MQYCLTKYDKIVRNNKSGTTIPQYEQRQQRKLKEEQQALKRPNLPNQYGIHMPLAPQHHRSSEGALVCQSLSCTGLLQYPLHRASCASANLLGASGTSTAILINFPRHSLDTKDEYCLNSSLDKNRTPIFGTVWASYFLVLIALLFTLAVVFLVSYYVNTFTYKSKLDVANAEKIFGKTLLKNNSRILNANGKQAQLNDTSCC